MVIFFGYVVVFNRLIIFKVGLRVCDVILVLNLWDGMFRMVVLVVLDFVFYDLVISFFMVYCYMV